MSRDSANAFLMDLYSTSFIKTAAAMGYFSVDEFLDVDIETAIINQMKRDKKPPFPWEQPKREYAAPEDLQDECTFNGEVFTKLQKLDEFLSTPQPAADRERCRQEINNPSSVFPVAAVDRKDVSGKPDVLRIPYEALLAFAKVSSCGFEKYGDFDSWKNSQDGKTVYSNALARHLFKLQSCEIDEESGLPHVMHILWNAAVLTWFYERAKSNE